MTLPAIDLEVDRRPRVLGDGSAVLRGNYTCAADVNAPSIQGHLAQRAGHRSTTTGAFAVTDLVCNGTPRAWRAPLTAVDGAFRRGKARLAVTMTACSTLCSEVVVERKVKLARARWR